MVQDGSVVVNTNWWGGAVLAGRIVHNRHGCGPVPVVCCATSRRFGPVTSEQRRDLALMWHSKGVPMEDITRLLHISEQEARDIITGLTGDEPPLPPVRA